MTRDELIREIARKLMQDRWGNFANPDESIEFARWDDAYAEARVVLDAITASGAKVLIPTKAGDVEPDSYVLWPMASEPDQDDVQEFLVVEASTMGDDETVYVELGES